MCEIYLILNLSGTAARSDCGKPNANNDSIGAPSPETQ